MRAIRSNRPSPERRKKEGDGEVSHQNQASGLFSVGAPKHLASGVMFLSNEGASGKTGGGRERERRGEENTPE
jgi:hypothetical protein